MLISKVSDDGGKDNGNAPVDDSHEYQTANDLFELMAKNQNFNVDDAATLTPGELVLLYKNIDHGTKLMSNANQIVRGNSNQRVETIVYNDDPGSDSSDLSEVYSNEDLQSVILVNKEQIDFLSSQPSVENTLCHKLGDLELQTCDYEKHFLFHDPFLKEQLKSVNLLSFNKDVDCASVLPPSLLDYICCRRLEDNYNFYMDNIIRYVKNTIEQLKRISNGDYLTDKAKEKWKEVENIDDLDHNNTKVLATSTSIPLHVECKIDGLKPTWDDIVHSAVDVRSLSKILEKKIIVEIPKFINGSYTLLSKCCNDNLIIRCQKDNQPADESRVDVVLQLERSETGHVISKISSIMILQTTPIAQGPHAPKAPLPLMYNKVDSTNDDHRKDDIQITELNSPTQENNNPIQDSNNSIQEKNNSDQEDHNNTKDGNDINTDFYFDSSDSLPPEQGSKNTSFFDSSQDEVTDSRSSAAMNCSREDMQVCQTQKEASFDICPADLRMTIKRLVIQSALPEESTDDSALTGSKKKSPTRGRIKSPYENQSYIMEEKKRRKLLEIREKRERRKKALIESCKITKHKYDNGGAMPQASTSVTKLSITNKSFYNSIYGHSTNVDAKQAKNRNHKRDLSKEASDASVEDCESEPESGMSPEVESQKFINRSYYLDDTVTEMMYMNMKQQEKEMTSASTSGVSCDFRTNLNILSQLMMPFVAAPNPLADETDEQPSSDKTSKHLLLGQSDTDGNEPGHSNNDLESRSVLNVVPSNTPKGIKTDTDVKKLTVECRKSIDKIYQLMNKLDKNPYNSGSKSQNTFSTNTNDNAGSTQESESGTSLKHQTSSSPSTFSFDKQNNNEAPQKRLCSPRNVVPKVIISSRAQMPQNDNDRNKKDRKGISANSKLRDKNNPLKAISQLLHDFENVQRNRVKPRPEHKALKRNDILSGNEGRSTASRQNSPKRFDLRISPRAGSPKRRSRFELHHEDLDSYIKGSSRPGTGMESGKVPFQQIPIDPRYPNRVVGGRKRISDILDEAKEAKGEAVRGPSKFNSRLNSLAQPKKSYVQAHSEEYQTRYGRNLITDRLQRLAAIPSPPVPDRTPRIPSARSKLKRSINDAVSPVSLRLPLQSGLPIDRGMRSRYSNSSSPDRIKHFISLGGTSYKHNVSESPKILKKKMVAVESYVKNHYGRTLSASPVTADKTQIPQKLRAPVLPNDIDTGSKSPLPQESTEVGSKLHRIIETMLSGTSQGLDVLTECLETTSKSSKDDVFSKENSEEAFSKENSEEVSSKEHSEDVSINVNYSQCDEIIAMDSDFAPSTTDDGIVLSSDVNRSTDYDEIQQDATGDAMQFIRKYEKQPFKPVTELDKIEEPNLSRPLSVGTFSKYMRIDKLSLSPKSSIQQLLLLQAGDAGSLVFDSGISQKLISERMSNYNPMNVLSAYNSQWDFPIIPDKITVAYALSEYEGVKHQTSLSPSLNRLFQQVSKTSLKCTQRSQSMVKYSAILDTSAENSTFLNVSSLDNTSADMQYCKHEVPQPDQCDQASQFVIPDPIKLEEPNCCCNAPPQLTSLNEDPPSVAEKQVETDNDQEIKTISENQTKLTQTIISEKSEEKSESDDESKQSGAVDYTTSLDILVGLLNEIQKITTCQTYMTQNETEDSKELEMIVNNTAGMVNSIRSSYNISITSLDKLRCLESNQSVYSFYISDGEVVQDRKDTIHFTSGIDSWYKARHNNLLYKPVCEDKEVNVDIANNECVDRLTDVPSLFFPVAMNHSANLTSSLMLEELCQTSTQSMFSFADYRSTYSNTSSLNSSYSESYSNNVLKLIPQMIEINDADPSAEHLQNIEKINETKALLKPKSVSLNHNYAIIQKRETVKKIKNEYCLESVKFDPVMKLKRDILVTVYSMLVLTVFAALSFPGMLYHMV